MKETAPHSSDSPQLTEQHRELLDQVLDKWSLQILDALCERPLRFNELRRAIPIVTQKPLTAALRRLERNGMVERIVTSTRPVAVEYRITPIGKTLQDLIDALLHWTTVTLPAVEQARERFDDQEELPSL
ncbi:winged helix-turn-helix transcriptional regulator [Nocardia lijiangensis]|uniref:winged helix-turn-helix transcriptional regulator n=1 Tax=Nocardia lijiangensis TaxID=299618 RepID=UPI0008297FE9|nr:helix-turn-helix domain-containing protein [Nocardia lijiangensis]